MSKRSVWMKEDPALAATAKPPNLLVIIADDLGFSDVGCFGAEIRTPNLDKLAADGVRLLNFHSASACSPTRAMVLTGTDAHLGGLGCIIEQRWNDYGKRRWGGKNGYEGYLTREVAPLSEILEDNGYFTLLSGKWHLGMRQSAGPWARGFKKSFTHLPGCSNHWGWEPMLEEQNRAMPIGGRPVHAEDGRSFHVVPNKTQDPEGFYSSKTYAETMVRYLKERDPEDAAKPFFGYLAFSATHWPLHCSREAREHYRGIYDKGPFALREARLARLKAMGIIGPDVVPHEVVHPDDPEWDGFNEYEKACSCRAMEAYAGMVEMMDDGIGHVIDYLKSIGEYDNTMIVFQSDNGAEGASYEAIPVLSDKLREVIPKYFDNSLDNIGNWNSYTWLGPLWASASTAPSRLFKCFTTQGGIRVPGIVKMPEPVTLSPKWAPGGFNRSFTTCMDIAPTFLELLGISLPTATADIHRSIHRGRLVHSMMGKSWVPYALHSKCVEGESEEEHAVYGQNVPVGWELMARAALRKGDWKLVHIERKYKGKADPTVVDDPNGWELFNLAEDPGENIDLGEQRPDKLAELLADFEEYAQRVGLVWGPQAMDVGRTSLEAPWQHDDDHLWQKAWLQTPHGEPLIPPAGTSTHVA